MCKCFPRNKCGPPEDSQHGIILDSVLEVWVEGQTDFSKEHLRVSPSFLGAGKGEYICLAKGTEDEWFPGDGIDKGTQENAPKNQC